MERRPHGRPEPARGRPAASAVLPDGTLAEMVYDPAARRTAFAVWREGEWRLEPAVRDGEDLLVPFPPGNDLVRNRVLLLPSGPEQYGDEEALLVAVEAYVRRYVDLSPVFERVASAYVLLSWAYDAFNELPYLRVRGDYGSGKTRFLLTVGALCYRPFFASGASTMSPVFHTTDAFRGTLVVDEADFRWSDEKAEMVKLLNNGNVRGMPVLRTMVTPSREFAPRAFQVYGPKLVATRGPYDDRALESRFVTEDMGERPLRPDIPVSLPSRYHDEALALRNRLLLWRFRTRPGLRPEDDLSALGVEARLRQIFVPLLAVVRDPARRRALEEAVRRCQEDLAAGRAAGTEAALLEALRDLAARAGPGAPLPVKDLAAALAGEGAGRYPATPKQVGGELRRRLRLRTRKSHGTYAVPPEERPRLEALWARYGIAPPAEGAGDVGEGPEGPPADVPDVPMSPEDR